MISPLQVFGWSGLVALMVVAIAALYRLAVGVARGLRIANPLKGLTLFLLGLIFAGATLLWWGTAAVPGGESPPMPPVFRLALLCEYLAGVVCYVEALSLLSRGYSLRILVDAVAMGDRAELGALKANYGGGWGVRGLLAKRLDSLVKLRFLRPLRGDEVGPLAPLGRLAAFAGGAIRKVLRLEGVG